MKSLVIVSIAQAVTSQFLWSNPWSNDISNPHMGDQDPLISDLFNDFNLDISLPPNTQTMQQSNDDNFGNSFFGNSLFGNAFGPQTSFGGFHHAQPLFITMYHPQNDDDSTSILLKKQHKINDDTWRYSLDDANADIPQMKTWSTHKLYLCGS